MSASVIKMYTVEQATQYWAMLRSSDYPLGVAGLNNPYQQKTSGPPLYRLFRLNESTVPDPSGKPYDHLRYLMRVNLEELLYPDDISTAATSWANPDTYKGGEVSSTQFAFGIEGVKYALEYARCYKKGTTEAAQATASALALWLTYPRALEGPNLYNHLVDYLAPDTENYFTANEVHIASGWSGGNFLWGPTNEKGTPALAAIARKAPSTKKFNGKLPAFSSQTKPIVGYLWNLAPKMTGAAQNSELYKLLTDPKYADAIKLIKSGKLPAWYDIEIEFNLPYMQKEKMLSSKVQLMNTPGETPKNASQKNQDKTKAEKKAPQADSGTENDKPSKASASSKKNPASKKKKMIKGPLMEGSTDRGNYTSVSYYLKNLILYLNVTQKSLILINEKIISTGLEFTEPRPLDFEYQVENLNRLKNKIIGMANSLLTNAGHDHAAVHLVFNKEYQLLDIRFSDPKNKKGLRPSGTPLLDPNTKKLLNLELASLSPFKATELIEGAKGATEIPLTSPEYGSAKQKFSKPPKYKTADILYTQKVVHRHGTLRDDWFQDPTTNSILASARLIHNEGSQKWRGTAFVPGFTGKDQLRLFLDKFIYPKYFYTAFEGTEKLIESFLLGDVQLLDDKKWKAYANPGDEQTTQNLRQHVRVQVSKQYEALGDLLGDAWFQGDFQEIDSFKDFYTQLFDYISIPDLVKMTATCMIKWLDLEDALDTVCREWLQNIFNTDADVVDYVDKGLLKDITDWVERQDDPVAKALAKELRDLFEKYSSEYLKYTEQILVEGSVALTEWALDSDNNRTWRSMDKQVDYVGKIGNLIVTKAAEMRGAVVPLEEYLGNVPLIGGIGPLMDQTIEVRGDAEEVKDLRTRLDNLQKAQAAWEDKAKMMGGADKLPGEDANLGSYYQEEIALVQTKIDDYTGILERNAQSVAILVMMYKHLIPNMVVLNPMVNPKGKPKKGESTPPKSPPFPPGFEGYMPKEGTEYSVAKAKEFFSTELKALLVEVGINGEDPGDITGYNKTDKNAEKYFHNVIRDPLRWCVKALEDLDNQNKLKRELIQGAQQGLEDAFFGHGGVFENQKKRMIICAAIYGCIPAVGYALTYIIINREEIGKALKGDVEKIGKAVERRLKILIKYDYPYWDIGRVFKETFIQFGLNFLRDIILNLVHVLLEWMRRECQEQDELGAADTYLGKINLSEFLSQSLPGPAQLDPIIESNTYQELAAQTALDVEDFRAILDGFSEEFNVVELCGLLKGKASHNQQSRALGLLHEICSARDLLASPFYETYGTMMGCYVLLKKLAAEIDPALCVQAINNFEKQKKLLLNICSSTSEELMVSELKDFLNPEDLMAAMGQKKADVKAFIGTTLDVASMAEHGPLPVDLSCNNNAGEGLPPMDDAQKFASNIVGNSIFGSIESMFETEIGKVKGILTGEHATQGLLGGAESRAIAKQMQEMNHYVPGGLNDFMEKMLGPLWPDPEKPSMKDFAALDKMYNLSHTGYAAPKVVKHLDSLIKANDTPQEFVTLDEGGTKVNMAGTGPQFFVEDPVTGKVTFKFDIDADEKAFGSATYKNTPIGKGGLKISEDTEQPVQRELHFEYDPLAATPDENVRLWVEDTSLGEDYLPSEKQMFQYSTHVGLGSDIQTGYLQGLANDFNDTYDNSLAKFFTDYNLKTFAMNEMFQGMLAYTSRSGLYLNNPNIEVANVFSKVRLAQFIPRYGTKEYDKGCFLGFFNKNVINKQVQKLAERLACMAGTPTKNSTSIAFIKGLLDCLIRAIICEEMLKTIFVFGFLPTDSIVSKSWDPISTSKDAKTPILGEYLNIQISESLKEALPGLGIDKENKHLEIIDEFVTDLLKILYCKPTLTTQQSFDILVRDQLDFVRYIMLDGAHRAVPFELLDSLPGHIDRKLFQQVHLTDGDPSWEDKYLALPNTIATIQKINLVKNHYLTQYMNTMSPGQPGASATGYIQGPDLQRVIHPYSWQSAKDWPLQWVGAADAMASPDLFSPKEITGLQLPEEGNTLKPETMGFDKVDEPVIAEQTAVKFSKITELPGGPTDAGHVNPFQAIDKVQGTYEEKWVDADGNDVGLGIKAEHEAVFDIAPASANSFYFSRKHDATLYNYRLFPYPTEEKDLAFRSLPNLTDGLESGFVTERFVELEYNQNFYDSLGFKIVLLQNHFAMLSMFFDPLLAITFPVALNGDGFDDLMPVSLGHSQAAIFGQNIPDEMGFGFRLFKTYLYETKLIMFFPQIQKALSGRKIDCAYLTNTNVLFDLFSYNFNPHLSEEERSEIIFKYPKLSWNLTGKVLEADWKLFVDDFQYPLLLKNLFGEAVDHDQREYLFWQNYVKWDGFGTLFPSAKHLPELAEDGSYANGVFHGMSDKGKYASATALLYGILFAVKEKASFYGEASHEYATAHLKNVVPPPANTDFNPRALLDSWATELGLVPEGEWTPKPLLPHLKNNFYAWLQEQDIHTICSVNFGSRISLYIADRDIPNIARQWAADLNEQAYMPGMAYKKSLPTLLAEKTGRYIFEDTPLQGRQVRTKVNPVTSNTWGGFSQWQSTTISALVPESLAKEFTSNQQDQYMTNEIVEIKLPPPPKESSSKGSYSYSTQNYDPSDPKARKVRSEYLVLPILVDKVPVPEHTTWFDFYSKIYKRHSQRSAPPITSPKPQEIMETPTGVAAFSAIYNKYLTPTIDISQTPWYNVGVNNLAGYQTQEVLDLLNGKYDLGLTTSEFNFMLKTLGTVQDNMADPIWWGFGEASSKSAVWVPGADADGIEDHSLPYTPTEEWWSQPSSYEGGTPWADLEFNATKGTRGDYIKKKLFRARKIIREALGPIDANATTLRALLTPIWMDALAQPPLADPENPTFSLYEGTGQTLSYPLPRTTNNIGFIGDQLRAFAALIAVGNCVDDVEPKLISGGSNGWSNLGFSLNAYFYNQSLSNLFGGVPVDPDAVAAGTVDWTESLGSPGWTSLGNSVDAELLRLSDLTNVEHFYEEWQKFIAPTIWGLDAAKEIYEHIVKPGLAYNKRNSGLIKKFREKTFKSSYDKIGNNVLDFQNSGLSPFAASRANPFAWQAGAAWDAGMGSDGDLNIRFWGVQGTPALAIRQAYLYGPDHAWTDQWKDEYLPYVYGENSTTSFGNTEVTSESYPFVHAGFLDGPVYNPIAAVNWTWANYGGPVGQSPQPAAWPEPYHMPEITEEYSQYYFQKGEAGGMTLNTRDKYAGDKFESYTDMFGNRAEEVWFIQYLMYGMMKEYLVEIPEGPFGEPRQLVDLNVAGGKYPYDGPAEDWDWTYDPSNVGLPQAGDLSDFLFSEWKLPDDQFTQEYPPETGNTFKTGRKKDIHTLTAKFTEPKVDSATMLAKLLNQSGSPGPNLESKRILFEQLINTYFAKEQASMLALMHRMLMDKYYPELENVFKGTKNVTSEALQSAILTASGGYQRTPGTSDPDLWAPFQDMYDNFDTWSISKELFKCFMAALSNTVDPTWKTDWFRPGPFTPIGMVTKWMYQKNDDDEENAKVADKPYKVADCTDRIDMQAAIINNKFPALEGGQCSDVKGTDLSGGKPDNGDNVS